MAKGYFEGWYFKQQAPGGETLALIPGAASSGAFLQVLTDKRAYNVPFPQGQYRRANPAWLGGNRFSLAGVKLGVAQPGLHLAGRLQFSGLVPLAYDIMGPLAALPMECRHTVLSMNHRLRGHLVLNGQKIDFTGGHGYIEGDRGASFPDGYTWAQCNHFPFEASVMMAAARLPVGPARVWGCTAVVWAGGRQYRIASYLGGHIAAREKGYLQLKQRGCTLSVHVPHAGGYALAAPQNGGMVRTVHESPATPARFKFAVGSRVLLDAESPFASYEFVPGEAR